MFILRNIVTAVTDLDLICWSDPYPKKKKSSKVLKFKLNCTILKLLYIISGPVLDPQYRRNYCKFFVQYRHIPGDFLCIFKGLYLFAEVFSLMVSISRRFFVRKRGGTNPYPAKNLNPGPNYLFSFFINFFHNYEIFSSKEVNWKIPYTGMFNYVVKSKKNFFTFKIFFNASGSGSETLPYETRHSENFSGCSERFHMCSLLTITGIIGCFVTLEKVDASTLCVEKKKSTNMSRYSCS